MFSVFIQTNKINLNKFLHNTSIDREHIHMLLLHFRYTSDEQTEEDRHHVVEYLNVD